HYARRLSRIHRRTNIPPSRPHHSVTQGRKRFVHRSVIAVVVNQNLRSLGNLPCNKDRKPVRIRCRQRKLPVRQPAPPLQLGSDPQRILRRQHQRNAFAHPLRNCVRHHIRRVPRHRARIAQTQVHVVTPVHIRKVGALRTRHKNRKCARPLAHPVHRHATQQRVLSSSKHCR